MEGLVSRIGADYGSPFKVTGTGGRLPRHAEATVVPEMIDLDPTFAALCLLAECDPDPILQTILSPDTLQLDLDER